MRVLLLESRRGVGHTALLLIVGALVLAVQTHTSDWLGDWYATSMFSRTLLVLLGPFAVGLAAWSAARDRRTPMAELMRTVSVPRPRLLLSRCASAYTWCSTALLLVTLPMLAATALRTDYGHWSPELLLVSLAALALFVVLGATLGTCVPSRSVAALGAVGTYAGLVALNYSDSGWAALSPAYTSLFPFAASSVAWSLATAGAYVAAAMLLVGAYARSLRGMLVSGALLVITAAPVAHAGSSAVQPDPGAQQLVCREGQVTVCVRAPNAPRLEWASAEVGRLLGPWADVEGVPDRVVEQGLAGPLDPATISLQPTAVGPRLSSTSGDPDVLRADVLAGLLAWNCPDFPSPELEAVIQDLAVALQAGPEAAGADEVPVRLAAFLAARLHCDEATLT